MVHHEPMPPSGLGPVAERWSDHRFAYFIRFVSSCGLRSAKSWRIGLLTNALSRITHTSSSQPHINSQSVTHSYIGVILLEFPQRREQLPQSESHFSQTTLLGRVAGLRCTVHIHDTVKCDERSVADHSLLYIFTRFLLVRFHFRPRPRPAVWALES